MTAETQGAAGAAIEAAMDSAAPFGDVLELACGPGTFRGELARRATFATAPDALPEMLEIAAARTTPHTNVRFAQADLFAWRRWNNRSYGSPMFARSPRFELNGGQVN